MVYGRRGPEPAAAAEASEASERLTCEERSAGLCRDTEWAATCTSTRLAPDRESPRATALECGGAWRWWRQLLGTPLMSPSTRSRTLGEPEEAEGFGALKG